MGAGSKIDDSDIRALLVRGGFEKGEKPAHEEERSHDADFVNTSFSNMSHDFDLLGSHVLLISTID